VSVFHRHRWVEVRRYFVPARVLNVDRASEDLVRELAQGVTVVELRCDECGDVQARRLPGDATDG
jgi:hypothetical protein